MAVVHPLATFTWSAAQAEARALSPASDPVKLLAGGVAAADIGVVLLTAAGAFVARHGHADVPLEITSTALLAAVLTFNAMRVAGCYTRHATASAWVQVARAAQGWSIVSVLLLSLGYLTKTSTDFSRLWAMGWYASALVGFVLVRLAAAAQLRRWREGGRLARTVAVVDLSGAGEELARRMLLSDQGAMRLIGVFSPQPAADRRNGLADLVALSRLFRIDEVIIAVSGRQEVLTDAIIRKLGTIPTNVRLCPEMPKLAVAPREAELLFGQPVLTVYQRPLTGWDRIAKRAEDIVLSAAAIVLLAPLLAALAVLIKLDSPGPALFRQRRLGFNNNVIEVLKFRTMTHQAVPETDVPQAQRHDPRVTRLGRLLRKTSIDELPQLVNVLRGEMSLVGPRPHALAHNEKYAALIDDYLGRHRVQPGITGWAQVNGFRGETETLDKMQRRVEHDLAYIDSWSLALDIKILLLTVLVPVSNRNAY